MAASVNTSAVFCLLLGSCSLTGWLISRASALDERHGPLQRASASPINVDASLDCAIKELAWDYAKKLLPRQGSFQSAYDALQLEACNVSLSSGKRYPSRPFQFRPQIGVNAIEIFVSTSGDDSNPGTMSSPVQSISQALRLYRLRSQPGSGGMVYLRAGTFYLSETVKLGPEDSGLTITAYQDEKVTISGGRSYTFAGLWTEVINEMGPIVAGISAINDSDVRPGASDGKVKYYGSVSNASDCQKACILDGSCFAFTFFDPSVSDFGKGCYFRIDGLWSPVSLTGASSGKKLYIVAADLSSQKPVPFTSLFLNGRRAVRARYPDGNPETMGLHTRPTGYVSKAETWLPPNSKPPAVEINIGIPNRNGTHFPNFSLGIGGPVEVFQPPESYWGVKAPVGGGGFTYMITTGLQYSASEGFASRTWKRPETGVVHAFHCRHWGNWQFRLSGRDDKKRQLTFAYGGWQEARGCSVGTEWYVENIMEELDAPGEWYFDDLDSTLYYFPNGSAPPTGVIPILDRLLSIEGSMDAPVYNVTIANVTFAHTRPTYFEPHLVPSGGDYTLHKSGAVFAEGVDGFTMQNCLFDSPGGNGLYLSEYMRNVLVEENEFVYCGENAIAAIGKANLIDGTDGNQPRGMKIVGNLMREFGVWGKQTAGFFQSVACQTELVSNVMFNGPRAGININDGFGGGNYLSENLVFNMVRETSDHGTLNSWDRQPYITTVNDGTASLSRAQNNITRNFFINNYHSAWPLDHDDGSCYWYDTFNYLVYGGYKNFLGHSKVMKYNAYIYPDAVMSSVSGVFLVRPWCSNTDGASLGPLPSGWGEVYANNTCIIGNPNVYNYTTCYPTGSGNNKRLIPFSANNTFYAPKAFVYFHCGGKNLTLSEWQALGYDLGSTVTDLVDTATVIQWGKNLLGI